MSFALPPRDTLAERFDAVVMLTVSDWETEPRSNRYHYATRFARHLPVIFVEPDQTPDDAAVFEPSGADNITLLHVNEHFNAAQGEAIRRALNARGIRRPLLWIYSGYYGEAVERIWAEQKVFHATEDYFQPELRRQLPASYYTGMSRLLRQIDLLVAVSNGVRESYQKLGGYRGDAIVLENGCDFAFWREPAANPPPRAAKTALYQGGINYRLDFALLSKLAKLLPDWTFQYCGAQFKCDDEWADLRANSNVEYLGVLTPEQIRDASWRANVGIIPFVQTPFIQEKSLPLKAFEYVACDMPVVTVPINALARRPDQFAFATTAEQFADAIASVGAQRDADGAAEARRAAAAEQDYDSRFAELTKRLLATSDTAKRRKDKLDILVLYASNSVFTATVMEHTAAFARYSRHRVTYAHAVHDAPVNYDMSQFDVVVVHYAVRMIHDEYISPHVVAALKACGAYKVLFIQDEYEKVERARRWMEEIGYNAVFTCVPNGQHHKVYPHARFAPVDFIANLTGYVPESLEQMRPFTPVAERRLHVAYRGRPLHWRFGVLGQEKTWIADGFKKLCVERGVPHDIDASEEARIYGDAWYDFLGSSRAVLGAASGSNVFDEDGTLQVRMQGAMDAEPSATFEHMHARFLKDIDGVDFRMDQISPRVFEAIATRTALVLFEGEYSGVVTPDVHFIPLKKDFSNADAVFAKLNDIAALETMTERAYTDVIGSGGYSYAAFITAFDDYVSARVRTKRPSTLLTVAFAQVRGDEAFLDAERPLPVAPGDAVNWPIPRSSYTATRSLPDKLKE